MGAPSGPGDPGDAGFRRTLVRSWPSVPSRPGASLEVWWNHEGENLIATVTQDSTCAPVARFSGDRIEFPCGSVGWRPAGSPDAPFHVRTLDDAGALAVGALRSSGTYCGSQAWTDFQECGRDPVWREVVECLRDSLHAAGVLLS